MFKLNVMGHMKNLSQMIEDGSFEHEFMPLYEEAMKEGYSFIQYHNVAYPVDYADAIVAVYRQVKRQGNTDGLQILEQ
jgi:ketopantoate reductase